jgi:hypothetical protein
MRWRRVRIRRGRFGGEEEVEELERAEEDVVVVR